MARTSAAQKLGKRLKQLRHEANLTQEKLSIATGISQTYISGIETGHRNPSIKTLDKIAKALGVRLSDVTNFDDYRFRDRSRFSRHL
ncbi:MAG TPA: helix-turn-helix transcriptional regulator [Candidatus Saccharimonadales bacterium]|nr:helix-turn-helix transcriptional regulator [Candidatus Saccharimonadales bacterium]